jgi:hypothetical protein
MSERQGHAVHYEEGQFLRRCLNTRVCLRNDNREDSLTVNIMSDNNNYDKNRLILFVLQLLPRS